MEVVNASTFLNQAQLHITGLNLKTKQLCLPKTYDIKTNNVTTGTKYLSKRTAFIPSAIYVEMEAQAVLKQPVPPTPLLQCSSESLQYEAGKVGAVDGLVSAMEYNRHIFRKEYNFKEDSTDGQYAEQVDKIRRVQFQGGFNLEILNLGCAQLKQKVM
ncbi:hypothetical protein POM88_010107 [Heracleum sosnowskyi]|uniref:Uncharacterized protein n=1 Tax=Heracleum sosnowskyi TaxID=360622 RepID=A0AAD8JB64_9APIA|nr:hypothetical protein POM88_010107 [Heracleum sosnowskyi]